MSNLESLLSSFDGAEFATDRWRILTKIGAIATPLQLNYLIQRFDKEWRYGSNKVQWGNWLSEQVSLFRSINKNIIEPFKAKPLSPNKFFYSDFQTSSNQKTLLVAVTGNVNRIMLPLHTFLQALPAKNVDVLVYRSRNIFTSSTDNALENIGFHHWMSDVEREVLSRDVYRHYSIVGSSVGGLPAVLAGLKLNFGHILGLGVGTPYDLWWSDVGELDPVAYLESKSSETSSKITLALGAQSHIDMVHAQEIANLIPVNIVKVSGKNGEEVFHACLHPLAWAGVLPDFFVQSLYVG